MVVWRLTGGHVLLFIHIVQLTCVNQMPNHNTSGIRVNNTQTTPRAKKSRTAFYRCHLKANKPLFSSDRVDYTNVIRATCEEHALGCFLAQFRALSRVCCRCRHHTRKPGVPLQVQPLKQAAMAHLITLLAFIAPIAVVFGWVLSNQHRAKEIGKLLTSIFESHE